MVQTSKTACAIDSRARPRRTPSRVAPSPRATAHSGVPCLGRTPHRAAHLDEVPSPPAAPPLPSSGPIFVPLLCLSFSQAHPPFLPLLGASPCRLGAPPPSRRHPFLAPPPRLGPLPRRVPPPAVVCLAPPPRPPRRRRGCLARPRRAPRPPGGGCLGRDRGQRGRARLARPPRRGALQAVGGHPPPRPPPRAPLAPLPRPLLAAGARPPHLLPRAGGSLGGLLRVGAPLGPPPLAAPLPAAGARPLRPPARAVGSLGGLPRGGAAVASLAAALWRRVGHPRGPPTPLTRSPKRWTGACRGCPMPPS